MPRQRDELPGGRIDVQDGLPLRLNRGGQLRGACTRLLPYLRVREMRGRRLHPDPDRMDPLGHHFQPAQTQETDGHHDT